MFHKLSYQQARHFYRPVAGVYVANPGYVFGKAAIPRGSIVTGIGSDTLDDLDDLERVLESLPDDAQVPVRFVTFDEPQTERQRLVTNDRSWFPAQRCHRDDQRGIWPCLPLAEGPPPEPVTPSEGTTFPQQGERHVQAVTPSLVLVNFDMPYTVSGVADRYYYGTGLIADAERGWVVVDRNTVPVAMGDVRLTFAGSLEIPGRVEYIHPLHNLAVVSYDPKLIGDTPVKAATFVTKTLVPGDDLAVVGLSPDFRMMSQSSEVANVSAAAFPLSRTLRFRDTNLDVVTLVNGPSDFDGTLVDLQGRVLGMWASFAYQSGRDLTQVNLGISADVIVDMVDKLRAREPLRSIEVEWAQMPLATARKVNLPEEWVQRYEAHNPAKREVLTVATTVADSPAAEFFRSGDILLSMDGALVNTFREAERASQEADRRGHRVARRPRGHRPRRHRHARRARHRTRRLVGRRADPSAASRACRAARRRHRRGLRELLQFRLAGQPFGFVRGAAHRGRRRRAHARSRGVRPRCDEPRRQGLGPAQHDVVQRRARSHHDEARPRVLAELRAPTRRLRMAPSRPELR